MKGKDMTALMNGLQTEIESQRERPFIIEL